MATHTSGAPAESYRAVLARLPSANKKDRGGYAYTRFVNRRFGRLIAAAAYQAGLSPNQVTAISAAFTFAGIACLAVIRPAAWTGLLVTPLLVTGYAFDSADGMLARLTKRSSLAGEWLDHVVDCAKIASLHLAVAISLYRFFHLDSGAYLLVPLGYSMAATLQFFCFILSDQLRRTLAVRLGRPVGPEQVLSTRRAVILVPLDYGFVTLIFLPLGWRTGFLWLYGAMFVLTALFVLSALPKWFATVGRFDAEAT